ncbi:MAG: PASTA domain-containing protein [Candidatus Coatesbacteria bacterium]|nr:MAG: PASTA domain-containing protein [Candidatus Coatesbacteria bacterium]
MFVIYAALTVFFAAAVGRLFWLQVIENHFYAELAREQSMDRERIPAVRGVIYDRNGHPLAVNEDVVSVYCIPGLVRNKKENAEKVAEILGVEPSKVLAKFESNRKSEWLGRELTPEVGERIMELRLAGVFAEPGTLRVYPEEELACHVLGYVGRRDGSLAGAERGLNQYLEGLPGVSEGVGDAVGRQLPVLTETYVPPLHGLSCVLTIDKWCQHVAERELARAVEKHRAAAGAVVIMRPATGEVLAMASYPNYDPNRYNEYKPEHWRNNAVSYLYEPGSTIKPFIAAAALEEGVVRVGDEFDVSKKITISGYTITDLRPLDAALSVEDIIAYSSNIGIVKISNCLGSLRTFEYLELFGFGAPTGINLPGESRGLLDYERVKYPVGRAYASFGQGFGITPLQMALAVSVLANGGRLMRPMLVRSVLDDTGAEAYRFEPTVEREVLSPEVARKVRLMMEQTVVRGGGELAVVEGYRVAGKTGTSQVGRADGRGYLKGVYNASFVGIVPVDKPEVVIVVVIFRPRGEFFGGKVAAPVFARIAEDILPSLKVPPTGTPTYNEPPPTKWETRIPKFDGADPSEAITEIAGRGFGVRLTDAGGSVSDMYINGTGPCSVVELRLSGELGVMPDVEGKSFRDAMRLLAPTGAAVTISGEGGDVIAQSPAPGRPIKGEVTLELGYLEPVVPALSESDEETGETDAAG